MGPKTQNKGQPCLQGRVVFAGEHDARKCGNITPTGRLAPQRLCGPARRTIRRSDFRRAKAKFPMRRIQRRLTVGYAVRIIRLTSRWHRAYPRFGLRPWSIAFAYYRLDARIPSLSPTERIAAHSDGC